MLANFAIGFFDRSQSMPQSPELSPGLIVIHGNHL
jgi:hypothetical protein